MQNDRPVRIVSRWIFIGVLMLIVQVLLGGITRLTGSGLSITEWKPIMGTLPPLNETDWNKAFERYQQIAQYKFLNQHFTLGDFKFIFFWEWFHRLWARLIGVVFLIPFIYFLAKNYFKNWMIVPLVILFLLGALQGAIGWIMVQSGLNDNDLYVSHIRLAAHFMAAMVLIGYALVFGLMLTVDQKNRVVQPALKTLGLFIAFLLLAQLVYGAFMAGLKAANVASTWPDINGELVPSNAFKNILHDKISIHFIHRTLAYIIFILIGYWWIKARNITYSPAFNKAKNATMLLVIVQVVLGIFTVLISPKITVGTFGIFEWLALCHQLVGMLLFLSMVAVLYLTTGKRVASPVN